MDDEAPAAAYLREQEREWALQQPRSILERARMPGWTDWHELRYRSVLERSGLAGAREASLLGRKGPGRPSWTAEQFLERYEAAIAETKPPLTDEHIAENFTLLSGDVGCDVAYLKRLRRRFAPERE